MRCNDWLKFGRLFDHAAQLGCELVATGHYRNGILLAPITADAVSAAVLGREAPVDLAPFSATRLAPRGAPR